MVPIFPGLVPHPRIQVRMNVDHLDSLARSGANVSGLSFVEHRAE